jgi:two-component system response regulator CssR
MSFKVFLVEDNKELGELLSTYLLKEGWVVKFFDMGYNAIEAISEKPQIWILDIMLPDTDGFEILKKIKEATPDVPVIFISARDQTLDRVLGLEMGSDDYIAKPFLPRELVIRVKRLLERTYSNSQSNKGKLYVYCSYEISEERRSVTQNGTEITLTSKEADLVILLAANVGKPFSRDALLNLVWDENYFGSDRVVDDLIRRVRKKLPDLKIETVYGQGYRLVV